MTPTFSDITYFIEVSETRNISRAAERLGITQPSLSAAVKRLEESIGAALLIRSRSGVQLTKAGQEFVGRGRLLLSSWEQLRADVNRRESGVSGQYRIGCHPAVALYTLSRFLPRLVQQHPDLEIKLTHDLSRKITEEVISFGIDFGLVVNPVQHPDLVIRDLCTDDVLFWSANKPSSTQTFDPDHGILICDLNLAQTQKLIHDLAKRKQGFKRVIQSSDLEVITDLTAAGVGIGIIPQRVAMRANGHRLKVVDKNLPIFKDKISLIYRADAQGSRGSQAIIAAIKASIQ